MIIIFRNMSLPIKSTRGSGSVKPFIRTQSSALEKGSPAPNFPQRTPREPLKHPIACLSGSLGVLCGKLGAGEPFSKALDCVRMNGFTEPDPRVDLIGKDMLRKMIIITRFAGHDGGCKKIVHSPMLPKDMSEHTVDEFMKRINCFDDYFKRMYDEARMEGKTIKFVVQFDNGVFRVGIKSVAFDSHIGCLQEAQKLIILTTENGEEIIVEGRGSGAISAAANVLEDVLALSV
mmetsp:Transcript_33102/g.50033  ORF Transcript_33102/g.50033 Transcript_33102/m.50033 type:complete len:233 (-) Transcript_33102:386-1084(-)